MTHEAVNVSMVTDYFTIDGLTKKTGVVPEDWSLVILKETVDNALDAIEPLPIKRITIEYDSAAKTLSVFDNGDGIQGESIEHGIYDFSVYHSSKRHYVTPSRGKQGVGLKTVVCICFLRGYDLIWHTAEGELLRFRLDDSRKEYGEIRTERQAEGQTDSRGITINGFNCDCLREVVREYSVCNPDVNFTLLYNGSERCYSAVKPPSDRSDDTNIAFYDISLFKAFLGRQDGRRTYKQILQETFGTAIANKSTVKGRLKDIDTESREFAADFSSLRTSQTKKRFTALKAHQIGLDNSFFAEDEKTGIPYCVEYSIRRLPQKTSLKCLCYVNNSITYYDAWSIDIKGDYRIGNRKTETVRNLYDLLEPYNDYAFTFHFISPQLSYMNTGKTEFDVTGIAARLCEELTKTINREQRQHRETTEKKPTRRALIRAYLPQAFRLASSDGKYSITARQLYYKVRELSGIEETATTYADYTQNILTEWLEQNQDAEDKIYFSDRGNFYIGSEQNGLGTGSVRAVINADGSAANQFRTYGKLSDRIFLQPEFDLRYRYDKCLYLEKTGFDQIIKAEGIADRYHMIIVSGQGFGTRAAKTLLHYLQSQGLTLYCLHDLDFSGIQIINSLREPNEKFPEPIRITDLGVTLEDVTEYGIKAEQVKIDRKDYEKIDQSRYTPEERTFLFRGGYLQRVELNAFTTEQLLEIIDRKLSTIDHLPKLRLSEAVNIDTERLKETALMRVLKKKFGHMIDLLPDPDMSDYDDAMTAYEIQAKTQGIIDKLLDSMEAEADEKLNNFLSET